MKVNRSKLVQALQTASAGLAAKELIEQTTSFVFIGDAIITYNDEISLMVPIDFELEGVVEAQKFLKYLQKLKVEEIEIENLGNELEIKSGKASARFTFTEEITLPFDSRGDLEDLKWKKLPKDFKEAIKLTAGNCSSDLSTPILTHIHINKNIAEATDKYRVLRYEFDNKVKLPEFLLPASITSDILSITPTEYNLQQEWIHFRNKDQVIISCRVMQENYVNIDALLERIEDGDELEFPKDLNAGLEKASIFTDGLTSADKIVDINIKKGKMEIEVASADSFYKEKFRIKYKGEELSFTSAIYTMEGILAAGNKVTLNDKLLKYTAENWTYISQINRK